MAIGDDVRAVLREELADVPGAATMLLPQLLREHIRRCLRAKVKAYRRRHLDRSALVAARQATEAALSAEESQGQAAEKASDAQVDADMETF